MKNHLLLLTVLFLTGSTLPCRAGDTIITNPVAAYAKFYSLPSGSAIYQWEVDLNHDGRKEILLDSKPTVTADTSNGKNEEPVDPDGREFTVYIPVPSGSGYFQSKGTDFGTFFSPISLIAVNPNRCFLGKITQLNKWGLVMVDNQPEIYKKPGAPIISPASTTISAYTLEGDHLKLTQLAKYNPDKGKNPIYQQYLSAAHRTPIQLQTVTTP